METVVPAAIYEMAGAHDALNTPIEGLRDLLSLDILPETREAAQALLVKMLRRQSLLHAAITSCEAVLSDGYPAVPSGEGNDVVLLDISNQIATITSAEGFFAPPQAVTLNLLVSPPVPKET